jgi:hypothetical protein
MKVFTQNIIKVICESEDLKLLIMYWLWNSNNNAITQFPHVS